MIQKYPSVLLENAVNELASLPGVGRKTALRLALYMMKGIRKTLLRPYWHFGGMSNTARFAIISVMKICAPSVPTISGIIQRFA